MSKRFFTDLMKYIDDCQEKLEKFNKKEPDWEDMEYIIELITRETEISTLKWIRDKYYDYIEE